MILPNHKLHHWMHKCIFKTCFTTLLRVERRSCSSKKCFIGSNFCFVKAVENKSGSSELLLYVSLKYLINIRKRKKLVKYQNCIIFSPTAQRANLSKIYIFWLFLKTLLTMQKQTNKKNCLASLTHCWVCIFIWYSRVKSWSLDCSSKVAWIQKFNTIFRFINFSVIWVQWIIRRSSKSFVSYTQYTLIQWAIFCPSSIIPISCTNPIPDPIFIPDLFYDQIKIRFSFSRSDVSDKIPNLGSVCNNLLTQNVNATIDQLHDVYLLYRIAKTPNNPKSRKINRNVKQFSREMKTSKKPPKKSEKPLNASRASTPTRRARLKLNFQQLFLLHSEQNQSK